MLMTGVVKDMPYKGALQRLPKQRIRHQVEIFTYKSL